MGVPDESAPLIAEEVRRLSSRLGGARAFVGASATRDALARHGRTARLIHIAAHADHREDDPALSALRLGDGPLTVADLHGLRLSPSVLVLSGCSTGRVRVTEGDDPFGLPRAFLHAGATTIVHSLWRVADGAALLFVEAFHAALARVGSAAAALGPACLAVRAAFPHPVHWAPFAVYGKGGPAPGRTP
jgi:CHAT domain-containing protein